MKVTTKITIDPNQDDGAERRLTPEEMTRASAAACISLRELGEDAAQYVKLIRIHFHTAGNGRFYACSPVCPHEDGPLAEGWLEGDSVVCPWHGFDFDLQTGRCRINDYLAIPVYPVRVRADAVEVDLP